MKKIILSLLCAGMVVAANAQEKSVLLFGDLGGSTNQQQSSGTDKTTISSFNIAPGVGYQFSKHWTLGVEGIYQYYGNTHNPATATDGSIMQYGGGVFGRYTLSISSLLYFYTQADVLYIAGQSYADGNSIPGSGTNELEVKITPAIGLNIKNGYAINFGFGNLGFNYTTGSDNFKSTFFGYSFSHGLSVGVSKNFLHHVKKPEPTTDVNNTDSE